MELSLPQGGWRGEDFGVIILIIVIIFFCWFYYHFGFRFLGLIIIIIIWIYFFGLFLFSLFWFDFWFLIFDFSIEEPNNYILSWLSSSIIDPSLYFRFPKTNEAHTHYDQRSICIEPTADTNPTTNNQKTTTNLHHLPSTCLPSAVLLPSSLPARVLPPRALCLLSPSNWTKKKLIETNDTWWPAHQTNGVAFYSMDITTCIHTPFFIYFLNPRWNSSRDLHYNLLVDAFSHTCITPIRSISDFVFTSKAMDSTWLPFFLSFIFLHLLLPHFRIIGAGRSSFSYPSFSPPHRGTHHGNRGATHAAWRRQVFRNEKRGQSQVTKAEAINMQETERPTTIWYHPSIEPSHPISCF